MYGGSSANTENSDRKKKSGRGHGVDQRRIGRAVRADRARTRRRTTRMASSMTAGEDQVLADRIGDERHAVLLQQLLVLLAVGVAGRLAGPASATR